MENIVENKIENETGNIEEKGLKCPACKEEDFLWDKEDNMYNCAACGHKSRYPTSSYAM